MPRLLPALLAALILIPATPAAAAWRTVVFDHTVQAGDRAALDRAGARAIHPAGARSYLLHLGRDGAERIAARGAAVRRVRAADKVAGGLRPGAQLATVVRLRDGQRVTEVVRLDAALTPFAIARRSDVLHVGTVARRMHPEDEGSAQLQAGNHVAGEPVTDYDGWLQRIGYAGRGVRIAVVDTGIDETHPDLSGKIVERIDYEFPAPIRTPLDVDELGHGTHVAGIVAGDPDQEGTQGFRDADGFYFGLGVAPDADLVAQNGIALTSPKLVPLIPTLTRDAIRAKASAWNASWHTGEGKGSGYIETVRVVDGLVRDGDLEAPGLQPFTMVFSAGNEGSSEKTITVPKEAKNIITVGASKGQRASGSTDDIASFSSRGPARDGRIEPTVVAPGEAISSARSKPAGGLCFGPASGGVSPIHSNCSGTSMAAPHVAGAVALLIDWWRRAHGGAEPSPAMLKALLVNSATDLRERDVPNGDEGWGRVDLGRHFATPATDRVLVDQSDLLSDPGASRTLRVAPVDPAKPLRVTLVWTDPPGRAATTDEEKERPALINDLDLSVTAPTGEAYLGNAFAGGRSVAGGGADRLNNVENVWLDQAAGGSYAVTVAANALPGDGVPLAGDTTDQDYALVVENGRLLPEPPPAAAPASAAPVRPVLKIRTGRARLRRTVGVALRTNVPLNRVRATLTRRGKAVARGRTAQIERSGKVVLRLPRSTREGTYVLTVRARTQDGRGVVARRKLKLTR